MLRRLATFVRQPLTALGLRSRSAHHRRWLLEMLPERSVGAEIGVHVGDFSAEILAIVRPASLHLIDPWEYQPDDTYRGSLYGSDAVNGQSEMDERYEAVRERFATEIRSGQVQVHRSTSARALGGFPDGHFDWVYIDGNHLYDFVKRDLELSYATTKAGGYIAGDDYREGGWWEGGVRRAVDEFVADKPVELITTRKDQFVIRR